MQLRRTGFAVLAFGVCVGAGALVQDEALAKGRCGAGQILRVSSGTCVSRDVAVQQGIIGGKRRAAAEAKAPTRSRKVTQEAQAAPAAPAPTEAAAETEAETTRVARAAPEPAARRQARTERPARQTVSDATEPAPSSPVRIEVVKTEPRPTPEILMPTWPYGELAAFPKRISP